MAFHPTPQLDPDWHELEALQRRAVPRYDERYGCCPVCRLGATSIDHLYDWTWASCTLCGTAWCLDDYVFELTAPATLDGQPLTDDQERALVGFLASQLRAAVHVPAFFPSQTGDVTMRSKLQPPVLFDPWATVAPGRRNDPDDPNLPPLGWHKLSKGTRERLWILLTEGEPEGVDLNAFGLTALGTRRRLQARFTTAAGMGESSALDKVLNRYFVTDPTEQAAWRRVQAELSTPEFSDGELLMSMQKKLTAAGDILATLRERKQQLDAQIATLEARTAGAGQ